MSGRVVLCLALIYSAFMVSGIPGCTSKQPATESKARPEKPLDVAIEEYYQAYREHDVLALDLATTIGYQHTSGSAAPMSKTTWLDFVRAEKADIDQGKVVLSVYRVDEPTVDYYEDAAYVTCRITVDGTRNGETLAQAYRASQLWVVENGIWKLAGCHESRIR